MKNLFIEIFETKMTLERMQEMCNSASEDHSKYSVIRQAQIIADSIRICLSSKNFETASSRFELINTSFKKILEEKAYLKPDEFNYIQEKIQETKEIFNTVSYLNASTGFKEKADKMKTTKGKLKYLNFAVEILEEGLEDPDSDKNKLTSSLSRFKTEIDQLNIASP